MMHELLSKKNIPHTILIGLFSLYLILGLQIPANLSYLIEYTIVKIGIILAALALFAYTDPVLGVLGMLVAYQLLKSSSILSGMAGLEKYAQTGENRWMPFGSATQYPYTLEQEMVNKMTKEKYNVSYVKAPYRPSLDNTHNAAYLSSLQ